MSLPQDPSETSVRASVVAGVRAAGILEEACREHLEGSDSLRLEVVRGLAGDIRRQLDALSRRVAAPDPADSLVDAALACADLATLAACNIPAMPPEGARRTADAVHLAARAAESLGGAAVDGSQDSGAEYLSRDARGARWKADLAARQADELGAPGEAG